MTDKDFTDCAKKIAKAHGKDWDKLNAAERETYIKECVDREANTGTTCNPDIKEQMEQMDPKSRDK